MSHTCVAIVLVSLSTTGTAKGLTRLQYATQCASEMGAIPAFNCLNGGLLDITRNGNAVTTTPCDKPIQLGGPDTACVPYSRLVTLSTGHPDVETIAICRKYHVDSGPNDPMFDDIAMISHSRTTGHTCFFQSPVDTPERRNGQTVPSPTDNTPQASDYWLEPTGSGPGGIRCTQCHAADPFIWSTYVAQRADTNRWDPFGRYDPNFQNLFGGSTKTFQPAGNACTSCHRFGKLPNDTHCAYPTPNRYTTDTKDFAVIPNEFWMPPGFGTNAAAWHASYDDDLQEINDCCADPNLSRCGPMVVDGSGPAPCAGFIGSPIAYYRFDDPANRGKDYSTHGNNGTLGAVGIVDGVRSQAGVVFGKSLRFLPHNNVNEFSAGPSPDFNIAGAMTGMAWINPHGSHTDDNNPNDCVEGTIFSAGGNYWFQVEQDNLSLVFQNTGSGADIVRVLAPIPLDTWTHVAFARSGDGKSVRYYVNGSFVGGGVLTEIPSSGSQLSVGNYGFNGPGDCEFNGDIDEIKIYNNCMSDQQIQDEYRFVHDALIYCLTGDCSAGGSPGVPIPALSWPATIVLIVMVGASASLLILRRAG